jgi:hypothetical protein
MAATITKVTYGDAQTRSKMRLWQQALDRDYQTFDRAYRSAHLRTATADFVMRSSNKGSRRAFDKLRLGLGCRLHHCGNDTRRDLLP